MLSHQRSAMLWRRWNWNISELPSNAKIRGFTKLELQVCFINWQSWNMATERIYWLCENNTRAAVWEGVTSRGQHCLPLQWILIKLIAMCLVQWIQWMARLAFLNLAKSFFKNDIARTEKPDTLSYS